MYVTAINIGKTRIKINQHNYQNIKFDKPVCYITQYDFIERGSIKFFSLKKRKKRNDF